MADISKISSGGVVYNLKDTDSREDIEALLQIANGTYEGRDLTTVFADEIANFTDAWAWIKNRIENANYTGLRIHDYIPLTFNSESHEAQISGIDTHYRTIDTELSHHIDFITRDCVSTTVQWNTSNNNNGSSTDAAPYIVSNLKSTLDEWVSSLPTELQNVISNKRTLMETRYSSSGTLTDSTGWAWKDLGKLWVPTNFEVFGDECWGTKGWSLSQAVQYPIFANSWKARIKGAGPNGGRCSWWLASVGSGYSTNACIVGSHGNASYWSASGAYHVPLCFRIAA